MASHSPNKTKKNNALPRLGNNKRGPGRGKRKTK